MELPLFFLTRRNLKNLVQWFSNLIFAAKVFPLKMKSKWNLNFLKPIRMVCIGWGKSSLSAEALKYLKWCSLKTIDLVQPFHFTDEQTEVQRG